MLSDSELPSVAVIVTVPFVKMDPAVAKNVTEVWPANTTDEPGTITRVLFDEESETVLPPDGAACVRVAMHVLVMPEDSV